MTHRLPRLIHAAAIILASVAAGVAVTAIGKPAPLPAIPSPVVTVIINLPKVLEGLAERNTRNAELAASREELKKQKEEYTKSLDAEKAKLATMADTQDKVGAAKAFREKAVRYDFELDFSEKVLAERQAEALRELCNKIQAASGRLAQLRSYHLVLSSDAAVPLQGNAEEVTRTVSIKRILFADPQIDVTDDLIQFMNNEHAAAPAAAPAIPPPAPKK